LVLFAKKCSFQNPRFWSIDRPKTSKNAIAQTGTICDFSFSQKMLFAKLLRTYIVPARSVFCFFAQSILVVSQGDTNLVFFAKECSFQAPLRFGHAISDQAQSTTTCSRFSIQHSSKIAKWTVPTAPKIAKNEQSNILRSAIFF
jgi:hypothetical protein